MYLTSIEIENFRHFEHYTAPFDRHFTLLMGSNGSGKSSLLKAILLGLVPLTHHRWGERSIDDKDLRRTQVVDPGGTRWRTPVFPVRIDVALTIGEMNFVLKRLRNPTEAHSRFTQPAPSVNGFSPESYLNRVFNDWLDPGFSEPVPCLARFGAASTLRGSATAGAVQQPFESKEQVFRRISDDAIDVTQLAQWFQYNEFDELDLHLHPQWQRNVVGDLRRVFPQLQFIVATHSPFLLQAAYEHGRVLDLSRGEFVEPTDHSVEDIAESVMGVPQPQRGQRFLELKRLAQEFYELLESHPTNTAEEAQLKARLDQAMAVFANDPASAAWLAQRRLVAGH